jgi:HSP20 family molecular chaperone IbpA
MRLRFKYVAYHFGADASAESAQQNLQRHYRQLMDDLFRQGQQPPLGHGTAQWRPPTDIHETPEAILVKMELAGMREEDIEVTLYEDALVVTGRREDDSDHGDSVYYHEAQIRYGPFRAEILLPAAVKRDAAEASYENGFLRVLLPRAMPAEREAAPGAAKGGQEAAGFRQRGTGSLAMPGEADKPPALATPRLPMSRTARGGDVFDV